MPTCNCQECGKRVWFTKDGKIVVHTFEGRECEGSWKRATNASSTQCPECGLGTSGYPRHMNGEMVECVRCGTTFKMIWTGNMNSAEESFRKLVYGDDNG